MNKIFYMDRGKCVLFFLKKFTGREYENEMGSGEPFAANNGYTGYGPGSGVTGRRKTRGGYATVYLSIVI